MEARFWLQEPGGFAEKKVVPLALTLPFFPATLLPHFSFYIVLSVVDGVLIDNEAFAVTL